MYVYVLYAQYVAYVLYLLYLPYVECVLYVLDALYVANVLCVPHRVMACWWSAATTQQYCGAPVGSLRWAPAASSTPAHRPALRLVSHHGVSQCRRSPSALLICWHRLWQLRSCIFQTRRFERRPASLFFGSSHCSEALEAFSLPFWRHRSTRFFSYKKMPRFGSYHDVWIICISSNLLIF